MAQRTAFCDFRIFWPVLYKLMYNTDKYAQVVYIKSTSPEVSRIDRESVYACSAKVAIFF
jgi:hypothetical protein